MDQGVEPVASLEREFFVNKIITDACKENPPLEVIGKTKITKVVNSALGQIENFEQAARHLVLPETPAEASRIKAIWCFSGPGTYDLPYKEDRYKDKPWARFMDRRRLNYSAFLIKKITEICLGERLDGNKDPQGMEAAILKFGPYLIYNGRTDENETVKNVLKREGVVIPEEKVHIIDAGIDSTIDQIRTFSLPPGLTLNEGESIALVSHAPHLMRVLHMINKVKPFPEGTVVKVFPLATPAGGEEYTQMEVRGLLYTTFISGESSEIPYPSLL